jgi:allene oxide cyclase
LNRLTTVAAPAIAAAIAATALASAGTTASKSKTTTFKAVAVVDSGTPVDNPPSGDSAGDILAFTQKLYTTPAMTKMVGRDEVYCVRTVPGTGRVCTGIFYLKGGQITITGPESLKLHSLAITGGTGKWRGASGEVVLRPKTPVRDDMTFHVVR